MSTWRKKLFGFIIVALLVCTFVFWGTLAGGCCLIALIQSFQVYLYSRCSSKELAKTFQECGKNVQGWRN